MLDVSFILPSSAYYLLTMPYLLKQTIYKVVEEEGVEMKDEETTMATDSSYNYSRNRKIYFLNNLCAMLRDSFDSPPHPTNNLKDIIACDVPNSSFRIVCAQEFEEKVLTNSKYNFFDDYNQNSNMIIDISVVIRELELCGFQRKSEKENGEEEDSFTFFNEEVRHN